MIDLVQLRATAFRVRFGADHTIEPCRGDRQFRSAKGRNVRNPGSVAPIGGEAAGVFTGEHSIPAMSPELDEWFSAERMAPYLAACHGDRERAEALYAWNADLSAACWRTLGHVEVLLRNALHGELVTWTAKAYGDSCWYRVAQAELHPNGRADIARAIRRASRAGRMETGGRVVAELSLGFWRYLLAARYDPTLWRWCLHRAFPHATGARRGVEHQVADLHRLRNRIAHMEPLHRMPLPRLHASALTVAGWICPEARDWIASGDQVPRVLGQRP